MTGCKTPVAATFALLCIGVVPLSATESERCIHGVLSVGKQILLSARKEIQGFEVRLAPYNDRRENDERCRAVVRDSKHRVIFAASDWAFDIAPIKHGDIASQAPYVILEGYSGGAHCCWTYYIIGLRGKIGLVKKFYNERGAGFTFDGNTRRLEIETLDGAFDYFDFLSHGETPFPEVYLRLVGNRLIDVSAEHRNEYDDAIRDAQTKLNPSVLATFKAAQNSDAQTGVDSNRRVASLVLEIVFAFLYSGRRTQAHQALAEMWPAFDQQRMWALILKTRREGVLQYLSHTASGARERTRASHQVP